MLDTCLVGAYMVTKCPKLKVDSSPEAIKEQYHRLGGILRYVLPNKESIILLGKNDKLSALNKTKLVDIFAPYRSIEMTDLSKENISYFILQYNFEYHGKYRNQNEFTNGDIK